ncbi:MAG: glycosyltransferase family 2 protein, partial [Candidatus Binatia bacterium]
MSSGDPPSVSAIVVNWNGRHLLDDCLRSIAALAYPRERVEILVFDNGSRDGSVEWLSGAWPAARVLRSESNLGFALACNRAAAASSANILAFLNNDLRVEPSWLGRMVEALRATAAAAAGSRILDWEGRCYDFDGAAMNFYGHGTSRRHGRRTDGAVAGAPVDTLFACGAAMVAERARFLASGGFDADYFAYFEDVDLGWRLWLEGERVVHVPGAIAYHRHHGSGLPGEQRTRLLEQNALATIVKNYEDVNLQRILPAALLLLEARARLASGERAAPYRDTLATFHDGLPALQAKRAAVQARRRRPDREIVPLFAAPFRPSFFGRAYWREQERVVRAFGIAPLFGAEGAMATSQGMDDFVGELQGRIEELEAELAAARQTAAAAEAEHRAEQERLGAEIARLRSELHA